MENEKFEQGDGVLILEGIHSLQAGTNGVVVEDCNEYVTVAGLSSIHPNRVIINCCSRDEIVRY